MQRLGGLCMLSASSVLNVLKQALCVSKQLQLGVRKAIQASDSVCLTLLTNPWLLLAIPLTSIKDGDSNGLELFYLVFPPLSLFCEVAL